MNGIELKKKKSMPNTLIRYVFGVFFILSSLVYFSSSFTTGLLFLLAGIVAIPLTAAQLEKKLNISMSGTVRFFVVFFLVILASASAPQIDSATTLNDSTDVIAAPLTPANGTTTTAMPASTEIPEVATTPDNKGILNILTSPAGATITVDGVSQESSPVKGLSVDEGNHIVDLYLSGYNAKTLTVYVKNSDTKTINWTFTPYVKSSPTTETPEVTPTETSTSESSKEEVATSDSKSSTISNTTNTKNASYYENSKSTSTTASTKTNTDSKLIYASSKSHVYHAAGCKYVQRIKPENLITFSSRKDAEKAGYRACKVCGG